MARLYNIEGSPFARLSAEEERDYLREIFYKQQYYDALVELAEASASRFILGQRGQGKSATLLHLFEDMKKIHLLPILIDQYDGFAESANKNYFLYAMINRLTFELAECIMKDKSLLKKLNPTQKQQLGLYIEMFYDPITASHCIESAESIASIRRRNKVKSFINEHLSIFNGLIRLVVKVGSDLIKSATGLGNIDTTEYGEQYLREFQLTSYKQVPMETVVTWDTAKLKQMLFNLRDMAIAFGYKSVVVMFDKIDEISSINGQIEKVTMFISDFLADTSLLYSENLAIVVSLWSEVRRALSRQGIRFDKFKEVDIRWTDAELVQLLNKRLLYFSKNKSKALKFETLLPNPNDASVVLSLADKSPRALFNLLGCVLDEERNGTSVKVFSPEALSRGYIKYCKKFDYASAQPTRIGKGRDVVPWITRLLRMKVIQFQTNEYATFHELPRKTAATHVETLLQYNLIKDSMAATENGEPLYEVADPRIRFLISRGEQSLES